MFKIVLMCLLCHMAFSIQSISMRQFEHGNNADMQKNLKYHTGSDLHIMNSHNAKHISKKKKKHNKYKTIDDAIVSIETVGVADSLSDFEGVKQNNMSIDYVTKDVNPKDFDMMNVDDFYLGEILQNFEQNFQQKDYIDTVVTQDFTKDFNTTIFQCEELKMPIEQKRQNIVKDQKEFNNRFDDSIIADKTDKKPQNFALNPIDAVKTIHPNDIMHLNDIESIDNSDKMIEELISAENNSTHLILQKKYEQLWGKAKVIAEIKTLNDLMQTWMQDFSIMNLFGLCDNANKCEKIELSYDVSDINNPISFINGLMNIGAESHKLRYKCIFKTSDYEINIGKKLTEEDRLIGMSCYILKQLEENKEFIAERTAQSVSDMLVVPSTAVLRDFAIRNQNFDSVHILCYKTAP